MTHIVKIFFVHSCVSYDVQMEPRSFGFMTPIAFLEKHTLEIHFGEGDGYACKHKKCNFETSSKKLLKRYSFCASWYMYLLQRTFQFHSPRHMETVPHRNGCAKATYGYIQEDGDFVQAPVTLVKSLLVWYLSAFQIDVFLQDILCGVERLHNKENEQVRDVLR